MVWIPCSLLRTSRWYDYFIWLWCKNFIRGTLDINEHIGWSNLQLKTTMDIFKWKHYEKDIILLTIRWYLKYSLSYDERTRITYFSHDDHEVGS